MYVCIHIYICIIYTYVFQNIKFSVPASIVRRSRQMYMCVCVCVCAENNFKRPRPLKARGERRKRIKRNKTESFPDPPRRARITTVRQGRRNSRRRARRVRETVVGTLPIRTGCGKIGTGTRSETVACVFQTPEPTFLDSFDYPRVFLGGFEFKRTIR